MMFRATFLSTLPRPSRMGFPSVLLCGLALFHLGCGPGPQAEFKFRDSTVDLIGDANREVKKTLKDNFGTPQTLVAWERFPVEYGGVKGAVTSIGEDKSLVVTVDGDPKMIQQKDPLIWISGSLVGEKNATSATVKSFDPESKKLVLEGAAVAAVGDRFAVDFGKDLQDGRKIYMKNCMHCHGVSGDGAGPTGEFLNPRPRDYRNGTFKFTSTRTGEKPNRDDLDRIVRYGIPGTYMPSFLLLGDHETAVVVEYVRWLSIRGEFEKRLVAELASDYSKTAINDAASKAEAAYKEKVKNGEAAEKAPSQSTARQNATNEFKKYFTEDYPAAIEETANLLAEYWNRGQEAESVVVPSVHRVNDTPESRERGRLLYLSDKTKCYTCHGVTGRGDGSATEDFWPKPNSSEKFSKRGLHDEWGNQLKPRNLTLGQYRGGRRPVDLFRRVYAGIKGTPMPAFGGTALKDDEIWDLVNYVMSLPYTEKQPSPAASSHGNVAKREEKSAH